jgi:hypothetical protein
VRCRAILEADALTARNAGIFMIKTCAIWFDLK